MPAWIHERAKHILAKDPSMKKSTAFAVATQQSHKLGKTPKGYGTAAGKREAKAKLDQPKKEYVKGANPGGLETPKLSDKPKTRWTGKRLVPTKTKEAMVEELMFILLDRKEKLGMIPTGKLPGMTEAQKKLRQAQKVGVPKTQTPTYKPLGAKLAFQTSQYSGSLGPRRMSYRAPSAMPGFVDPPVKTAGPPPGEEGKMPGDERKEKTSLAAAVNLLQKLSAAATTPAGRLAKSQTVGQPKTTNPPGPSIQQVAKPVGFGTPQPGATLGAV